MSPCTMHMIQILSIKEYRFGKDFFLRFITSGKIEKNDDDDDNFEII